MSSGSNDNKAFDKSSIYRSRFLIKSGLRIRIIKTEDIAYVYSENKLVYFVIKTGNRYASGLTLQDVQDQLNPDDFFRVNRQCIVHHESINEMIMHSKSRLALRLQPAYKEDIIVSTEKTPHFRQWLER